MCVVSMIGEAYSDRFRQQPYVQYIQVPSEISRVEFEELKREISLMKELLAKAIKYDKDNNEPHCEIEEKVALLKKMAEIVGIELNDIFPQRSTA